MKFVIFVTAISMTACATDKAASLRDQLPVTVLANFAPKITAEYRRSSEIGFNASVGGADSSSLLTSPPMNFSSVFELAFRNVDESGISAGIGSSWYPFQTSAFRIGASLDYQSSMVSFDADSLDKNEWDFPLQTRVSYERTNIYLGVPMGWNWIYKGGFSLGLDFGPRFRVSHSESFKNDGGLRVDTADRDSFKNDYESDRKIITGGLAIFGYSF